MVIVSKSKITLAPTVYRKFNSALRSLQWPLTPDHPVQSGKDSTTTILRLAQLTSPAAHCAPHTAPWRNRPTKPKTEV